MSAAIRVVIADGHLVIREGLRLMLETSEGIALVGVAANGREALRLIGEARPDVVLVDLEMPELDGLGVIHQVRAQWPAIAVVILTNYNDDDLMLRGLQAGACSYLLKDVSLATLVHTIQAAHRGEVLLDPTIMARLLARATLPAPATSSSDTELTEREQEVLAAAARGERSKEIALHLGIAERTVRAYLTSIYTKLGVDSRAAAVAVAIQRGLLPATDPTSR